MNFPERYLIYFPRTALIAGILMGTVVAISHLPIAYTGDIANIIERSYLISQGTSPLQWPDPPLRYLPISALMVVLQPIGLTPEEVTTAYMIMIEFVLIPITLFRAVSTWWSEHAAGWTVLLYGPLSFLLFPDVVPNASPVLVNTMFQSVFWMYAFAIPPILYAWQHAHQGQYNRAGVGLGLTALIELPLAAFAALVVAVTYFASKDLRGLLHTGGVSVLVSLPLVPFGMQHLDYWLRTGSSRMSTRQYGLFEGGTQSVAGMEVTILEAKLGGLLIFGVAILAFATLYITSSKTRGFVQSLPDVVVSQVVVLCTLELVLGVLSLALWYHILITYLFRFSLFAIAGIFLDQAITSARPEKRGGEWTTPSDW